jgi:predicted dehydrogenase
MPVMHTLLFLEPGHFHAALTIRQRHPRLRDEIVVYAPEGPELAEFLALVDAFNRRSERPTRWQPVVRTGDDSLERLLAERRGDAVVLAGKNAGKIALTRRLHDAGLPVLADKPWIIGPEGLPALRHVLSGGAVAMEIMTGRHEITSILAERLVREPDVFGDFRAAAGDAAISMTSVHHLEKLVNGTPLRRPPWYFDVRVQGDGIADIPTHLVDQAQRLLRGPGRPSEAELIDARRSATLVPRDLFRRVTGLADFPSELQDRVEAGGLAYFANAQLSFRLRDVTVAITTRWDLTEPPGSGDRHGARLRGTRAEIRVEQGPHTGFQRRLFVEPNPTEPGVGSALERAVAGWPSELGVGVTAAPRGFEIEIPGRLRTGHESHFSLVLDDFIRSIEGGAWPDDRAADTLTKYALLARASARATTPLTAPAPPEAGIEPVGGGERTVPEPDRR